MSEEALFRTIASLPHYEPSPEVDKAFTDLVAFSHFPIDRTSSLSEPKKRIIRKAAAQAEKELERSWAEAVSKDSNPWEKLRSFPYYANYADLVRLEHGTASSSHSFSSGLLVGSGPLPLTAILLAKLYGISCTLIDHDAKSLDMSKKVIESLGLEDRITCVHSSAEEYSYYHTHEYVILGALVGETSRKKLSIIHTIASKMSTGSLLLCRSSFGIRSLLYTSLGKIKHPFLSLLFEVRPHNDIVNSFYVLQKT